MGLESTDAIASYYGGFAIMGQEAKTPEMIIKGIESVTASDVLRVAKKLFTPKNGALAIVEPQKDDTLQSRFFDCLL